MTPDRRERRGGGWILRAATAAALVGYVVLYAGCRGQPPGEDDRARASATDAVPRTLECVRLNYPCTEAGVPREVEREGIRLAREILRRLRTPTGQSLVNWVREQPNVVHVVGRDRTIRFRLAGGRPVWVISHVGRPLPTAAGRGGSTAFFSRPSWPAWSSLLPRLPAVHAQPVGRDQDADEEVTNRDRRRALVLDPFRWEWTHRGKTSMYREGTAVVRMLEATPGFRDGGVVHYRPDEAADENAFRNWHTYDLVHFSGHGDRVCEDDGPCYTVVFTGTTRPLDQIGDGSDTARTTGIMDFEDPETGELIEQRHVGLTSDWFQSAYAGVSSLDRTIVVVNGCGTVDPASHGFVPDFLAPLTARGDVTIIGWDQNVPTLAAQKAVLGAYEAMIEHGLRAGDVIRRLPANVTAVENRFGLIARLLTGSGRGRGFARAKLRIREVVALHIPDGEPMVDGVQPPPVFPANRLPDTLNVDLVVDGVEPGERDEWSVDLTLDGETIRRGVRLSSSHKTGDHTYRVPLRDVRLGEARKLGRRPVLMAVADLPEGGKSRFKVEVAFASWLATVTGPVSLPVLSGRRLSQQLHVIVGQTDARAGPEPDLSPLPPLTIGLSAGRAFVEGSNSGLVTLRFRELGYTCSGFAGPGFELRITNLEPLEGSFEGRVICTPGRLNDPASLRDNLRQRFEARATGWFRGR